MILSAHQPAYLPWLGYFDKIKRCDLFVFMDTVQFETGSFINRNRIKTSNGSAWLTVSVLSKGIECGESMRDLLIDERCQWQRKHLNAIQLNYAKAKNFAKLYPLLVELYQKPYQLLVDLCWDHLMFWLEYLNIKTKVIRLSECDIIGKKSDLVLNMCTYFGAKKFISGALGKNYLIEKDFHQKGIALEYQEFKSPFYAQLHGNFIPNLAVVDYYMNTEGLL